MEIGLHLLFFGKGKIGPIILAREISELAAGSGHGFHLKVP